MSSSLSKRIKDGLNFSYAIGVQPRERMMADETQSAPSNKQTALSISERGALMKHAAS